MKPKQIFQFFKPEYCIPMVLLKGSDLYFRYFDTLSIYYTSNLKT